MESEILFDPSLSSINDYPLDPYNINGIDLSPEQEPEKIYIQMNDNNFNEGKNEKEEIISSSNESKFTPEKESYQIIKFEIVNSNYLFQPKNTKNKMEENKKINKFSVEQSDNKNEKTRKEKTDDIRKKIKSRFLKKVKSRINTLLENAGSENLFDFLPQSFIINVTKKFNKSIINMKYKDILLYECVENYVDYKKYEHNIEVMDYLNNNPEIMKKANFTVFGEMTFSDMFKQYLNSKEFELELENLKSNNESDVYINNYKELSEKFIDYYSQ
jgi:hypothetical protein